VVVSLAPLSATGRLHRAPWTNHRYRFTTWRWGRVVGLPLIDAILKLSMPTWWSRRHDDVESRRMLINVVRLSV
jgi:hypothetical protein